MDITVLKIRVDKVVKNIATYIMSGVTLEGKMRFLESRQVKISHETPNRITLPFLNASHDMHI